MKKDKLPIGYVIAKEPKNNRRSFALQQSVLEAISEEAKRTGTNINAIVSDLLLDHVRDNHNVQKMCEYCKVENEGLWDEATAEFDTRLISTDNIGLCVDLDINVDSLFLNIGYRSSRQREIGDSDLEFFYKDINYCPMCGRRLRRKLLPFKEYEGIENPYRVPDEEAANE